MNISVPSCQKYLLAKGLKKYATCGRCLRPFPQKSYFTLSDKYCNTCMRTITRQKEARARTLKGKKSTLQPSRRKVSKKSSNLGNSNDFLHDCKIKETPYFMILPVYQFPDESFVSQNIFCGEQKGNPGTSIDEDKA